MADSIKPVALFSFPKQDQQKTLKTMKPVQKQDYWPTKAPKNLSPPLIQNRKKGTKNRPSGRLFCIWPLTAKHCRQPIRKQNQTLPSRSDVNLTFANLQ